MSGTLLIIVIAVCNIPSSSPFYSIDSSFRFDGTSEINETLLTSSLQGCCFFSLQPCQYGVSMPFHVRSHKGFGRLCSKSVSVINSRNQFLTTQNF